MYKKISEEEFVQEMEKYTNNFTKQGMSALYKYLIELENDTGHETEIDAIGFACAYTEYGNLEEIQEEYSILKNEVDSIEKLAHYTTVFEIEGGGIIIQNF